MKKSKVIIVSLTLSYLLLVGCSNTTKTGGKDSTTTSTKDYISEDYVAISPEKVLKSKPNADIFIMYDTIYINATDIDWVTKLTLNTGKILGKINKTGVEKDFQNWNANKLKIETEIYKAEGRTQGSNEIVLVKSNNKYIPYLAFVEG